jgi:hypothetical protein
MLNPICYGSMIVVAFTIAFIWSMELIWLGVNVIGTYTRE